MASNSTLITLLSATAPLDDFERHARGIRRVRMKDSAAREECVFCGRAYSSGTGQCCPGCGATKTRLVSN